jgi:hypothetical protein
LRSPTVYGATAADDTRCKPAIQRSELMESFMLKEVLERSVWQKQLS